jgi:hypothetical protein
MRFNRDSPFALEIHCVENLRHHVPLRHGAGEFKQAIGKRGLSVIDVRNDREIADEAEIHAVNWGVIQIIPQHPLVITLATN